MNTYYILTALNSNDKKELIFGSYDKKECREELKEVRVSLKLEGYKEFCIKTIDEKNTFSSKEFFNNHAMDFNFELSREDLIKKAIKRTFIIAIDKDCYCYL